MGAIFGGSFLLSLSGALSPGPLTVLTARESLRFGFWAGPLAALGHGLTEILMVVALALGLSALLREQGLGTAIIAITGGLFLLWTGLSTAIRARSPAGPSSPVGGQPSDLRQPTPQPLPFAARGASTPVGLIPWAAALASVSNPYWVIWWASLGTASLQESLAYGAAGALAFYSGHVMADLLWLSLIAMALARGRHLLSPGLYRALLLGFGLTLAALGSAFLVRGIALVLGQ
ncbi:MAG TPA: LysE family transporter [Dehalococcoidia bacterium]|nr:LysE family transporter [Dehalococcoidia bacterium]